jgi:hypothetical protein
MMKYEAERSDEPDLQRSEMVTGEERAGSALYTKVSSISLHLLVVALNFSCFNLRAENSNNFDEGRTEEMRSGWSNTSDICMPLGCRC